MSWRVTCSNHASFRLLTIARRGPWGRRRRLILLRTQQDIDVGGGGRRTLYCLKVRLATANGYQFSSVQSLDRLGHRGNMRDNSAKILFRSCLQGALVNSSGMGRDVQSLMLSIQHFLCRPRHSPHSKVPRTMVLEKLSWRICKISNWLRELQEASRQRR